MSEENTQQEQEQSVQEQLEITGRVACEDPGPELRYTQTGKPVTNFAVYENSWGTVDGKVGRINKRTRVTAWEDLAQACTANLTKGCRVTVKGVLRPRTWEDSQGNTHDEDELVLRSIEQHKDNQ